MDTGASSNEDVDVIVVGSCNMDLISYIPHLPSKGETIHGKKFQMGFGGKGANQCVAAAKLGANTAMVGKVGEDVYGESYRNELQRLGVNTDNISTTKEAATGVAPCLVGENGSSAIVIVSGANLLLESREIKEAESMIKRSKIMVCQLEIREDATLAALRLAKKHGVRTIFNPAPRSDSLPDEIFSLCDVFCPNETEVAKTPVSSIAEAGEAALQYIDKGCGIVIVTLGDKGCAYVTKEDREVKHIPCDKVQAIDTTGAGDSFIGSLAYFMSCLAELPLDEMIRRSSRIASLSVQREGTQTSFPVRSELPASLFTLNS